MGESQEYQAVGGTAQTPTLTPRAEDVGTHYQQLNVLPWTLRVEGIVWNHGAAREGLLEEGCIEEPCAVTPVCALSLSFLIPPQGRT